MHLQDTYQILHVCPMPGKKQEWIVFGTGDPCKTLLAVVLNSESNHAQERALVLQRTVRGLSVAHRRASRTTAA